MAKSIDKYTCLKPGNYDGLWSGYYVEVLFENGKRSQKLEVNEGCRGINVPCKIKVWKNGQIIVN